MADLKTAYEKWLKTIAQLAQKEEISKEIPLVDPFTGKDVSKNCAVCAIVFKPTAIRFEVVQKGNSAFQKTAQKAKRSFWFNPLFVPFCLTLKSFWL
jgi:hypothetical protein